MFHLYDKINKDEVYVIAEMSANHGGILGNAIEIVRQVAMTGADCLKIQTYTADSMTIDCDEDLFKIKGGLWDGYKLYDLYKEACTPYEWQKEIKAECERCGIDFLSTPFDKDAVDFLESIDIEAYKIASFELVDIPLIEYVASKGKPIIISCGMGSLQEIQDAIDACKAQQNNRIVLLKCCSEYPTNWEDMYLGNIPDMEKRFGTLVGLSDHSLGSMGAIVGVTLGACVVEKHVKLEGVESADSRFSMAIDDFASMVKDIKRAKIIAEGPNYNCSMHEKASMVFRRSIFAVEDIEDGEAYTENNIRVIRPSDGMSPKYYERILGTRCNGGLKKGNPVCRENVNLEIIEDQFVLRSVEEADVDILYKWANESSTRKNSFNSEFIPYADHRMWFSKLLKASDQIQYIFLENAKPIGQIRFSVKNDDAYINFSIELSRRGHGYGKMMLELAKSKFHKEYPKIKRIIGQVKQHNLASKKCFSECNFDERFSQFEYSYEE